MALQGRRASVQSSPPHFLPACRALPGLGRLTAAAGGRECYPPAFQLG